MERWFKLIKPQIYRRIISHWKFANKQKGREKKQVTQMSLDMFKRNSYLTEDTGIAWTTHLYKIEQKMLVRLNQRHPYIHANTYTCIAVYSIRSHTSIWLQFKILAHAHNQTRHSHWEYRFFSHFFFILSVPFKCRG